MEYYGPCTCICNPCVMAHYRVTLAARAADRSGLVTRYHAALLLTAEHDAHTALLHSVIF